jgi:hypothetical protein
MNQYEAVRSSDEYQQIDFKLKTFLSGQLVVQEETTDGFRSAVGAAAAMCNLLALAQPQPDGAATVWKYLLVACNANDPATSFPEPVLIGHLMVSVKEGRAGIRWGSTTKQKNDPSKFIEIFMNVKSSFDLRCHFYFV